MTASTPERRTAMYHAQLSGGAVMVDADGWQLPRHFGDAEREAGWLRDTVGVSDISPLGKVRVVGAEASRAVAALVPSAVEQGEGTVAEADSPLVRGGKLLAVRLAQDEFLVLTPAGVAPSAVDAIRAVDPDCGHPIDVTSGLCGIAVVGAATQELMSRITGLDTSPRAMPDLACVESRFADIQALFLRRDVNHIPMYQLYAGREFGEYLWNVLVELAREVGGGPVGTEALLGLKG